MKKDEFYSLVLKKRITIPLSKIKPVTRSGRKFLVGTYTAKGKEYKAWKIIGKA